MNQSFIDAFNRFKFLKLEDLYILFKHSSFKSYKKGDIILKEGEYFDYVFLIRKGLIRTYVLTPNAEEKTTKISKEKDFVSCYENLNTNPQSKPSTEYFEALEDCKVIALNIKKLEEISFKNIRILRLSNDGIRMVLIEAVKRIEFFTILSPEERYKKLLKESPDLIQRVQQKHLASYLGVAKESLSRIRNRIASEGFN